MAIVNPTVITDLTIGAADRKDDAVRVDLYRSMNSIGLWKVALWNIGGAYNNTFDIQDDFQVDVNGNTLMEGVVDGNGVILQGADAEDIWSETVIISGYDKGQDLLFHNDFEAWYPNPAQGIETLMGNVFGAIASNINYAAPGLGNPVVGQSEFRRGTNFLSAVQELHRRVNWCFYVDDGLNFVHEPPGTTATGVTATSTVGGVTNNIIGTVDFQRRDGDKLYNKVDVYGPKPQFDAYTEYTAGRWGTVNAGWALSNDGAIKARITGNGASVRMFKAAPAAVFQGFTLAFNAMGQLEVDMSEGEIGFWWRYNGGTSAARACARVTLQDNVPNTINFFSGPSTPPAVGPSTINRTRTYQGVWGWCTVPVGRDSETGAPTVTDQWWTYPGAGFNWDRVRNIGIGYQTFGADTPTEMHIDGLQLPFSAVGSAQDAASIAAYRTRPLIVSAPYLRHQLILESKAAQLLQQHKDSGVDLIKFTIPGNPNIRYPGEEITVNIPPLGLNAIDCYITSLHHVIEPYMDVSDGYGFDWITEIEAIPKNGTVYDVVRLNTAPVNSAFQLAVDGTIGQTVK